MEIDESAYFLSKEMVMTKSEALQHVAAHLIGYLRASTPDEIHETDASRNELAIAAAMEEIMERLAKMGNKPGKPGTVVACIREGYRIGDALLRPAEVLVGSATATGPAPGSARKGPS